MHTNLGAESRRTFLKAAGTAAVAVGTAGCLGGITGGGSSENQEITIGMAPGGFQGIVASHILDDTDILAEEMSERGYSATIEQSWEETALFAAGGPDTSMMSSLEAAILATERELELATFARISPMHMGWWVERDGDYDPSVTGSEQATMDKIVEEGANVGIGSWAGGHIPVDTIVTEEEYGYTFSEEGGDFSVVTADYVALPDLVLQGEVAICGTGPMWGIARNLGDDGTPRHTEVFNGAAKSEELGLGVPPFNNLVVTQQFMEDHRDAAEAYIHAWHRGMDWLYEDPMGRILANQEANFEELAIETEEQAQYIVDWGVNLTLSNEYPYNYQEQEFTDARIESERNFLSEANAVGFIPDGWEERLTHHKVPQE